MPQVGLMPCGFGRFVEALSPSASPEEALHAYKEYEEACRRHRADHFAKQHQGHGILTDVHCWRSVLRAFDWRIISVQCASLRFQEELEGGKFAKLSLKVGAAQQAGKDTNGQVTDGDLKAVTVSGMPWSPPHFLSDPACMTLTLKGCDPSLSIWNLHEAFQQQPGFMDAWFAPSDAASLRTAYARFDSLDHLNCAVSHFSNISIQGHRLQASKSPVSDQHRVFLAPLAASQPECMMRDAELSGKIIQRLDAAFGISEAGTGLILQAGQENIEAQVDLRVLYLRRVHSFCYYSGVLCNDERDLASRFGAAGLRQHLETGQGDQDLWIKKHDLLLQSFFRQEQVLLRPKSTPFSLDSEPLRSRWVAHVQENSQQVADDRHRCGLCPKCFKGPEYMQKHFLKAHTDGLVKLAAEVAQEGIRAAFFDARKGPGWD